jgi:hypothetical protein
MVIDLIRVKEILAIAEKEQLPEEQKNNLKNIVHKALIEKNKRKRQPRIPAPKGGISLSAAQNKYGVPNPTICRWAKKGYLPILMKTRFETFVDENYCAKLAEAYKTDPRQGSWVVKRLVQQLQHNN